jgi:hypothetical protein
MALGLRGQFKGKAVDSGMALDSNYANVYCHRGGNDVWRISRPERVFLQQE